MRYIKIIKCSDSLVWYATKVGETVVLERETVDYYWAREPAGYINIVHKQDAEVIDESES